MMIYSMRKQMRRSLIDMKAQVLARDWMELQNEIKSFKVIYGNYYHSVFMNEFISHRKKLLLYVSYILHKSLIYRAPVAVIKAILNIHVKGLSVILVLLPFEPQNNRRSFFGPRQGPPHKLHFWCRFALHPSTDYKKNDASHLIEEQEDSEEIIAMKGMLPIEIACRQHLSPEIIRLLLEHDQVKFTHSITVRSSNTKKNILHYLITCALCRYRNQNNEPVLLDYGEEVWINKPSRDIGGEDSTQKDRPPFTPEWISDRSFREYAYLVKYLCKTYPNLIRLQDIHGSNSMDTVRAVRARLKRTQIDSSKVDNDFKNYCRRVECIYKLLKVCDKNLEEKVVDDRSENAQCGESTGYTLDELFQECSSIPPEVQSFVLRSTKGFV